MNNIHMFSSDSEMMKSDLWCANQVHTKKEMVFNFNLFY